MKKLLPVLFFAACGLAFALKEIRPEFISEHAIRAHMRFLSSDLLRGRATGSEGYDIGAQYMISQFEQYGLQPAFGDSSWSQEVVLSQFDMDYSGSALAVVKTRETKLLVNDEDYFMYSPENITEASGESDIIFAGYGIDYENYDYHPYERLSVAGKIVAVLWGEPDFIRASPRFLFNEKIDKAYSLGAKGIIFILPPRFQNNSSWTRMKFYLTRGLELKTHAPGFFAVVLNPEAVTETTAYTADSLTSIASRREFTGFRLEPGLSYHIQTNRNEILTTSFNIAAKLPGSDPLLKDEYVVYTSHLDHVGVGNSSEGDSIYNGAYDNASGCAIMLEVARAFAGMERPPLRSLLFVAVTAEEIGLFGSQHFVNHPPVPLENMVANINIDMAILEQPLVKAVALGKEYADFEDIVLQSAEDLQIELVPDPLPDERLFMRSDHYSFVQKGIPSLFIINDLSDSVNNAWFKNFYHSPDDEFSDTMHFEAAVKNAQLNFLIGARIAEKPERPRWRADSPFGSKIGG